MMQSSNIQSYIVLAILCLIVATNVILGFYLLFQFLKFLLKRRDSNSWMIFWGIGCVLELLAGVFIRWGGAILIVVATLLWMIAAWRLWRPPLTPNAAASSDEPRDDVWPPPPRYDANDK
ncbi:MAG: hypothetical protein ABIY70_24410 [Capsulimonas sp.]|uniref:hypothetical protein n=1 Tax=Capsulimonas sp. TaxID=2494211 RepID=UPI003266C3E7